LAVTATTVHLQENSVVHGKQTAEEDLFETKKKTPVSIEGMEQTEDTDASTTDQKEFKPQHKGN